MKVPTPSPIACVTIQSDMMSNPIVLVLYHNLISDDTTSNLIVVLASCVLLQAISNFRRFKISEDFGTTVCPSAVFFLFEFHVGCGTNCVQQKRKHVCNFVPL